MIDVLSPVTDLISADLNHRYAVDEMKRQHHYNKEYMDLSYKYGQAEQQNSAMNTKKGLQMAGLSPALASQGMFAPASGPSTPSISQSPNRSSQVHSPFSIGDFIQAKSLLAQADSLSADAEKTREETRSVKMDNANKEDANATAERNLETYFTGLQDKALKEGNLDLAERYGKFAGEIGSTGSLKSLHDYLNFADDAQLYELHHFEYELQKKVIDEQYKTGVWKDIASMPRYERQQMSSFIRNVAAQIENMNIDTASKKQELKLTEQQIEQIKILNKRYQNSDLNTMVQEGRWSDAGLFIFSNVLAKMAEEVPETAKEVGLRKVPIKVQHK